MDAHQLSWLKKTIQTHKGKHNLDMAFYESETQIKLLMHSRKKKINISPELLIELEDNNIHFKLN
jgi:DNA polymerase-3 subunit alpha